MNINILCVILKEIEFGIFLPFERYKKKGFEMCLYKYKVSWQEFKIEKMQ
jgi:hypothetical protein